MTFDALSNAGNRVSQRSTGATLDGGGPGGVKTSPSTPCKIQTTSMTRVRTTAHTKCFSAQLEIIHVYYIECI